MPVTLKSRYYAMPVSDVQSSDGSNYPTISIRKHEKIETIGMREHQMKGRESLEFLAWKFYGSSDTWWRIADSLELKFPLDLVSGEVIKIPSSRDNSKLQRTRRF